MSFHICSCRQSNVLRLIYVYSVHFHPRKCRPHLSLPPRWCELFPLGILLWVAWCADVLASLPEVLFGIPWLATGEPPPGVVICQQFVQLPSMSLYNLWIVSNYLLHLLGNLTQVGC